MPAARRSTRPTDPARGELNTTIVPLASSFLLHAPSCLLLHSIAVTSKVTSGGGSAQNALIALAPSVPGRPVGKRRSSSRRVANSDMPRGRTRQVVPVEMLADIEYLAFAVTQLARVRAQRVGRLQHQQLLARQQIHRLQDVSRQRLLPLARTERHQCVLEAAAGAASSCLPAACRRNRIACTMSSLRLRWISSTCEALPTVLLAS